MLNRLFHGSVGFQWGVRYSAFLTLGFLIIANICMIPRPPKLKSQNKPRIGHLLMDPPYALFLFR